jgi:hypothetical protein
MKSDTIAKFNKSQHKAVEITLALLLRNESGKPPQTFNGMWSNSKFNDEILLFAKENGIEFPDEIYKVIGRPLGTPLPLLKSS